jgi:CheY-like chemotaxis protein
VAPHTLAGIRVLVVDDHDDTREFVPTVLARYGAEVTTATSARSAVAAFERTEPHVMVSDVAMPREHGYCSPIWTRPSRRATTPNGLRTVRALDGSPTVAHCHLGLGQPCADTRHGKVIAAVSARHVDSAAFNP